LDLNGIMDQHPWKFKLLILFSELENKTILESRKSLFSGTDAVKKNSFHFRPRIGYE
jgi:hypothetical protein